jgi:hypothetical protein
LIVAIPVAYADFIFFRISIADAMDTSGWDGTIIAAAMALIALLAALVAGNAYTQKDEKLGHTPAIVLGLIWLAIGAALFVVRAYTPNEMGLSSIALAAIFFIVFAADGALAFYASYEFFDRGYWAYRGHRRKIKKLLKSCISLIQEIEQFHAKMRDLDEKSEYLDRQYQRINHSYFPDIVPALMNELETAMWRQGLLTSTADAEFLYESIQYDKYGNPSILDRRRLLDLGLGRE